MPRIPLLGLSSAIPSSSLRVVRTRGFAQLVTPAETMITKPDSPPPFLVQANRKRQVLPATWMRAGTSKGLFIDRKYLPSQQEAWSPWILAAMGSRNGDPRQLNGIGGATSTTSKVAIVSPSRQPGIDVEYTFAQVAIGKQKVDYSGNCGNIASGVGPYAIEEGMVHAKPGQNYIDVRILNTNTGRVLVETVAVDEEGFPLEQGDYQMAGVSDPGAEIKVAFVDPAGSMTGKLFPTGRTEDTVTVGNPTALENSFSVQATLIDAANPFVVVDAETFPSNFVQGSKEWLDTVEDIRREGAVMMGLANSTEQAALTRGTPKIMIVSSPNTVSNHGKVQSTPNISVLAMSMGQIHPSVQLTGAVCLAGASCIEGTVAYKHCSNEKLLNSFGVQSLKEVSQSPKTIVIGHRSGQIPVGVHLQGQDALDRCVVSRTARRMFEGNVLFYA